MRLGEQLQRVAQETGLDVSDLRPNWEAQTRRTVVPCEGSEAYEWRRTGQVVTLGTLFMALGKHHSALAIYPFYRPLRIVTTKKKRMPCWMTQHQALPVYA